MAIASQLLTTRRPTTGATFYATGLRCRACGEGYPLHPIHVCERCFGPLEVAYDDAALAPIVGAAQDGRQSARWL